MTKYFRYTLIFFLAAGLFSSCKKKTPENIGLPFLPGSDLLNANFTDTLTLRTHTVRDDSLRTDEVTPMLLGVINDPVFGLTRSSLFTQIALSKTNPSFGNNPILESAVLSLVYNNKQYYGNLSTAQKFDVYEVSQNLYKDSSYYSNKLSQYYTTQIIGSANVIPDVNDSVMVGTSKFPPHLRINLSTVMFQHFLDDPAYTASYNSNASFISVFKGIYIKSSSAPSSGQGAILYFDLASAYTRLTLYYHNDSIDSLSCNFPITKDVCARYTHFEHDYSSVSGITNQLNTADTIQESYVYVQPMAGIRTKITMPYLTSMFGGHKVAINKAELVLPVDPASFSGTDSVFSPHSKLVVTIADNVLHILPDYFEGASYFGGDYDVSAREYRFNISRYVQQVLNGTKANLGLYLITGSRPTTANRVKLMGGDKANSTRMRLKISYTPLD
jgi:hypothetical protein